jgi:hypothetical protein
VAVVRTSRRGGRRHDREHPRHCGQPMRISSLGPKPQVRPRLDAEGHCTPTPDEAVRILDRFAGFESIISFEIVRQALEAIGRINSTEGQAGPGDRLLGGTGHGVVDRPADSLSLQACASRRRGDPNQSSFCAIRRRLSIAPMRLFSSGSFARWPGSRRPASLTTTSAYGR